MKSVFLQGDALTHDALAEAFGFPAYYGRNLDALNDCLGTCFFNQTSSCTFVIHVCNPPF